MAQILNFIRFAGNQLGLTVLASALLYTALPPNVRPWLDIPCLFTTIAGINCPGCGIKTAIVELLSGRWHHAIETNWLAPPVVVTIVIAAYGDVKRLTQNGGKLSVRV